MVGDRQSGEVRTGCPASAVLLLALAGAQLLVFVTVGSGQAWGGVLVAAVCLLVLPVAVALWVGRLRECRGFAALLALGVGGTQLLAMTLGSPGGTPLGWSSERGLVVALAVTVVVLVFRRSLFRARRHPGHVRNPYASSDVTPAPGRGGRRRHRRPVGADAGA